MTIQISIRFCLYINAVFTKDFNNFIDNSNITSPGDNVNASGSININYNSASLMPVGLIPHGICVATRLAPASGSWSPRETNLISNGTPVAEKKELVINVRRF